MVDLCSSQESIGLASDPSDPVTPKRGRITLPELPRARPVPSKKGALKKQVVEKFKAKKKEGQSAKKKAVGSQKTKEKKKKTKACEVKTKKGASGKQKTKEKEEDPFLFHHPNLGRLFKTVSHKYKKAYFCFPSPTTKAKRHLVTMEETEDFEASPPPPVKCAH